MGFWLTVGKVALQVGVPALSKFAQERLHRKTEKARTEAYEVEDAQFWANERKREKREARERAKAAR